MPENAGLVYVWVRLIVGLVLHMMYRGCFCHVRPMWCRVDTEFLVLMPSVLRDGAGLDDYAFVGCNFLCQPLGRHVGMLLCAAVFKASPLAVCVIACTFVPAM